MSIGSTTRTITEAEIETFDNDGVVCLRKILDPAWIKRLRAASEAVAQQPSQDAQFLQGEEAGRFITDRFLWTVNDDFRAFAFESPLVEVASLAMRSKSVYLMLDLIFTKEPHTGVRTPWHHDQPYAWYDGAQVCQYWLPLDHVDQNSGVLEFVRGSHKWGKWFNPVDFAAGKGLDEKWAVLPDIEANREDFDIVSFEMEPGDVLLFSELTLHGAPPNKTSGLRRGVSVHYAGDDATYAVRDKAAVLPFRDPGLKPGQSFANCDLFPKVWPR
jgi:ectoine hydroxylase-related dioxygenase (phytanoyl-CoA dioxygenase family)